MSLGAAQNQYTTAGSESFIYNLNGSLTQRVEISSGQTTQNQYDSEDQLIKVIQPEGVQVSMGYDARGRRVSKTVGTVSTRFVWDGDELLAELDESGKLVRSYVYGIEPDEVISRC
jgi:YD repeat-containing protein